MSGPQKQETEEKSQTLTAKIDETTKDADFLQAVIDGKINGNEKDNLKRLIAIAKANNNEDSPLGPMLDQVVEIVVQGALRYGQEKLEEWLLKSQGNLN